MLLTALIPHTTVVLPILNMAELSAWVIDDIFTLIGRKDKNCLPSGRISCAFKFSIIVYKNSNLSVICNINV